MKAQIILPIERLQGALSDQYYIRFFHGKHIIQHKPRRTRPATQAQLEARQRFAATYPGANKKSPYHSH